MKRILFLLAVPALVAGCSRQDSTPAAQAEPPPAKVRIAVANANERANAVVITGRVYPQRQASLSAKVMGVIEEMPVTLGQRVKAGELLVKIAAGEISARVTQAESQLNSARRDLERERGLLKSGASTAEMVRGLEDRFAAAQAMVREAETMLSYAVLRAPFDGVVARKLAHAGDLAAPGVPLLELEGAGTFLVEVGIPESLVGPIEVGNRLRVEVPAADARFDGEIVEISSASDTSALTVLAKIAVPAGQRVRSGQFARVSVPGAMSPALLVPREAVSRVGQLDRVFVAEPGPPGPARAGLRLVKTGAVHGEQVEILAGLDAGERIVVSPSLHLREGQRLEAAQ